MEFCSDDRIRRLNADWRGKGRPTDVLSFTNFEVSLYFIYVASSEISILVMYLLSFTYIMYCMYYTVYGVQFESPEVFSRASQQVFRFNRQLGEIVIAPQYVLQQCREDKKDYDVSQSVSVDSAILLYDAIKTPID